MAEPNPEDETPKDETETSQHNGVKDSTDLEEKAIAQAMESADASYIPSPSLLASDDPNPLLSQVDGPSLSSEFLTTPSVYQAKSVPVALRAKFDVPIHVTAGGSVVEYEISSELYDIGFGVTAEREEGVTNVKENERVNSHLEAVAGKFLVGSVPCALIFSFDNEYSWFREKKVSYKIIVTPPKIENVIKGRRLRAQKALDLVAKERKDLEERYDTAAQKRTGLDEVIKKMEKELAEKKKSLDVVSKEESWLENRRGIRDEQIKMLSQRLKNGWEDEEAEEKSDDKSEI